MLTVMHYVHTYWLALLVQAKWRTGTIASYRYRYCTCRMRCGTIVPVLLLKSHGVGPSCSRTIVRITVESRKRKDPTDDGDASDYEDDSLSG